MDGLVFHEEGHRYTLDGQPVPGVTSVLKLISAADYAHVPEELMAEKAAFGTLVHAVIELDCAGELDVPALDPALVPYYLGWRQFLALSGFEVIMSEGAVGSRRHRYGGKLDLFGRLNGTPALVDAKRVTTVMPSTGPQTAAYENALRECRPDLLPAGMPCNRYALQLAPPAPGEEAARWRLHHFTNPADLRVFMSALTIHHWRESLRR